MPDRRSPDWRPACTDLPLNPSLLSLESVTTRLRVLVPILMSLPGSVTGSKAAAEPLEVRLIFPQDGLILTPAADMSPEPGVQVPLVGLAPTGSRVWVNGQSAARIDYPGPDREIRHLDARAALRAEGSHLEIDFGIGSDRVDEGPYTIFLYQLTLADRVLDVEIVALNENNLFFKTAVLYSRTDLERTYSITIDDVSDLLSEITRNEGIYSSIFEHPALGFLHKLHEDHGAVVSLYLFRRGTLYRDFDLDQMSDRFKAEWEENSDWLRLGFHAESWDPPFPYRKASYERSRGDLTGVRQQVLRFAGEKAWDRFMRSHFASGSRESCRAWRDEGIRGLYAAPVGYPSYYLSEAENHLLLTYDYWRDNIEDIVFVQTDLWAEKDYADPRRPFRTSAQVALARLDSLASRPLASQNIHLLTHEAFLHPGAGPWQVRQRVEETVGWLTDRGYRPRFDADDPFFASLPPTPPYDLRAVGNPGVSLRISWSHPHPYLVSRYQVYRKDLSEPLSAWVLIGETTGPRFDDLTRLRPAVCSYRVFAVAADGSRSGGSPPSLNYLGPGKSRLNVYPNPFNSRTTISYTVPEVVSTTIVVYNLLGQEVRRLVDQRSLPGSYAIRWNGQDSAGQPVGSGVYIVKLSSGAFSTGQKFVLLK